MTSDVFDLWEKTIDFCDVLFYDVILIGMTSWDEKNSTEPRKSSSNNNELAQNDTTSVIENGSTPIACDVTGRKSRKGIGGAKPKNREQFIKRAKEIHGDSYDYSLVEYINNRTPVTIICKIHGKFYQTPSNHTGCKHGCRKCGNRRMGRLYAHTNHEFVKMAKKRHGNFYDYTKVEYVANNIAVTIRCPNHGEFMQIPQTHLNGSGCPKCTHRISKPEQEFLTFCGVDECDRQKYVGKYLVDGLVGNVVYEFLGNYWHGNPRKFDPTDIHPVIKKPYGEIYRKNFEKFDNLTQLGYTIRYIWEDKWKEWKRRNFIEPSEIEHYNKQY